jgi:hypothetical protein
MATARKMSMSLQRLGPTLVGMLATMVTLVTGSAVWLFLASPATIATASPTGGVSPLMKEIAEALLRSLDVLLRYV